MPAAHVCPIGESTWDGAGDEGTDKQKYRHSWGSNGRPGVGSKPKGSSSFLSPDWGTIPAQNEAHAPEPTPKKATSTKSSVRYVRGKRIKRTYASNDDEGSMSAFVECLHNLYEVGGPPRAVCFPLLLETRCAWA